MPGTALSAVSGALEKGIAHRPAAAVGHGDVLTASSRPGPLGSAAPANTGEAAASCPEPHASPGYPGRGEALGSPAGHRGDDAPLTHLA